LHYIPVPVSKEH